jgi:hypothetical protein
MFVAPFTRINPMDLSSNARLGVQEAARQAVLLRKPGEVDGAGNALPADTAGHRAG